MKRNLFSASNLLLCFCVIGCFSVANGINKASKNKSQADEKVRYLEKIVEHISITKDVVFGEAITSTGTKQILALDIYSPENDDLQNRPVIFFIHGGGFRPGNDKTQKYIVEMASRFARKGYVCLSIDYRLRENPKDDPSGTISDALQDALKALDWLRKNSESLKADKSKIIVAGGSAGGILGCNLCFNDRADKMDKTGIIAFVDLWGTPDITWGELNIDTEDPPTVIVHGTDDQLVSYSNSANLAKKLKANNVKHELITIEGAGHTPVAHMDDFEKKIAGFLYELIR